MGRLLRNAFKNRIFEASRLVSTKTLLLLRHGYRRQGNNDIGDTRREGLVPEALLL